MLFPVDLSSTDIETILYWHSVCFKTKEPDNNDEEAATKLRALFISENDDDLNVNNPGRRPHP